jgi:hypothetical protein
MKQSKPMFSSRSSLTLAQLGPLPAALATLRVRGNVNRMIHDTVVRQARRPADQYAGLLRDMAGSRKRAPGVTDLEPLIDVLVHGQDMAIPLAGGGPRCRGCPVPAFPNSKRGRHRGPRRVVPIGAGRS